MKRLFTYIAIMACVFTTHSCLREESDIFQKDSSIRMTEYLENFEKVLTDGNATWMMEMYPSGERTYGGYAFTLRFTADSVYCQTELAEEITKVNGSLWCTTRNDGPALSFDTYNNFIHFFSTPSSSMYQAYKGEFEWKIIEVGQDIIKLRGKKTDNTVYLRRLNQDPLDYLKAVVKASESMEIVGLSGKIGADSVRISFNPTYRQIILKSATATLNTSYSITPGGIRLYEPITINGKSISGMSFNYDQYGTILSMTADSGDELNSVLPEGYRKYNDYIGSYLLKYYTYSQNARGEYVVDKLTSANVEIVAAGDNNSYLLRGLSPKADISVTYNNSLGVMEICSQKLGTSGTSEVWLCTWGIAAGGSFTAASQVGMISHWNGNSEKPEYSFRDNGSTSGFEADSYILWKFNEAGDSQGALTDRTWQFTGATRIFTGDGRFLGNRLPYFNKAVLIKE